MGIPQDLRYALRTLRRAPGFTCVAMLTLALGIGANTAVFSLVHATILKPLPFRDPSRLVTVWDTYLPQFPRLGVSPAEWEAWQQQSDIFEQAAWYRSVPLNLNLAAPDMEAMEIHATIVPARLLGMLGVAPALGRAFGDAAAPDAVLLSHELWLTRFRGDRGVVGRSVRLNEQEFTVAGVMPAGFQFPDWADVWLPPGPLAGDELTNPVRHAVGFVARLRPGVTVGQAAARLESVNRRLAAEHPKTSTGWGMQVRGLQEDLTAGVRPSLLMLMGAVTLVLLIACGNLANLLLSRATSRTREIAVRIALGAGAWRVMRQLLAESLVLAAGGGALGLVLAWWGLAAAAPGQAPLDATVLLVLVAVSTATGVAAGLAPALQSARTDVHTAIRSSRVAGGFAGVRGALVIAEFALAMVLATGAGVLAKSFVRLLEVNPGFEPRGLLTLRITVPPSRDGAALFHRIADRVGALPGVESVAAVNALPIIASRGNASRFNVPGAPGINPDALPAAQLRAVSPEYFRTMGIALRSGRDFTERDLTQPVVIVNETMARRFWPGRDAVGQKFITGVWAVNPNWSTIVGVVGDVKQFGVDSEPSMDLYFPSLTPANLAIRTAGDPAALAGAVRREIRAADAGLAVADVRTMEEVVGQSLRGRRWTVALLGAFAGLAVLLAMVGVYGVMAWTVEQRTREIGIRMALGADRGQVLRLVIRQGLALCAAGLSLGLAGAYVFRRVLASLIFQVSTADPAIYAGVAALMCAVAMVACYVPARRASRVDPLTALRWE